ncbi:hypothetical protein GC194_11100 [bacterium]|nr:hypothetical protein [bacterium]
MKVVKNIIIRLSFLVLLWAGLNYIYGNTLWYNDIDQHADTLENLWPEEDSSDIIYFGESSNFYQEHPDTPKVRISNYLDRMLPLRVGTVDNAGLVASNYLHIMQHIPQKSKVKAVVVTMNLRSFGPTWMYDQNSNYLKMADEMIAQGPKLLNRFFIALKTYDYIAPEELDEIRITAWKKPLEFPFALPYSNLYEWNAGLGNGGILREDGSWDMDKIPVACHFVKNYAFTIDLQQNPRIRDFNEIVAYAQQRGWKLYLHLLSENYEEAEKLVGASLVNIMEYNADLLIERYNHPEQNVWVVNNFKTVPNSDFRDRTFPTEHYNNRGKRRCAKKLAEVINH